MGEDGLRQQEDEQYGQEDEDAHVTLESAEG